MLVGCLDDPLKMQITFYESAADNRNLLSMLEDVIRPVFSPSICLKIQSKLSQNWLGQELGDTR
jgi:hypothetical protein